MLKKNKYSYSDEEDKLLINLFNDGLTDEEIEKQLKGRTISSIKNRRNNLGLLRKRGSRKNIKYKNPKIMKRIKELLNKNESYGEVANILNEEFNIEAKRKGIINHVYQNRKYYKK